MHPITLKIHSENPRLLGGGDAVELHITSTENKVAHTAVVHLDRRALQEALTYGKNDIKIPAQIEYRP